MDKFENRMNNENKFAPDFFSGNNCEWKGRTSSKTACLAPSVHPTPILKHHHPTPALKYLPLPSNTTTQPSNPTPTLKYQPLPSNSNTNPFPQILPPDPQTPPLLSNTNPFPQYYHHPQNPTPTLKYHHLFILCPEWKSGPCLFE